MKRDPSKSSCSYCLDRGDEREGEKKRKRTSNGSKGLLDSLLERSLGELGRSSRSQVLPEERVVDVSYKDRYQEEERVR